MHMHKYFTKKEHQHFHQYLDELIYKSTTLKILLNNECSVLLLELDCCLFFLLHILHW